MTNEIQVKQEVFDDEEDDQSEETTEDDPNTLGPAALGLQRVGTVLPPKPTPSQPAQVLNARGMPARIRKRNKLFFDDDIVNTPHHRVPSAKKNKPSPSKRTPKREKRDTPSKNPRKNDTPVASPPRMNSPDRKIGQKIGMRLRNLLKLPKAHKWVCYEWFCSNIDASLFLGENDFQICLRETFPELKTRQLSRPVWNKIRRMMGKPRRCSQAFFNEERLELEKKRKKIRALQQRKATDLASFKDLPAEIPMQLVIGTKVTARLRKPADGLYTGSIDAVDPSNNTYRITFERQGLGTHSVPDYEVLSSEPPETISVETFQNKFRPRTNGYLSDGKSPGYKPFSRKDPLLSGSMVNRPIFPTIVDPKVYNSPKLLELIALTTKALRVKQVNLQKLKTMNQEAEVSNSFDDELNDDFKKKYAGLLIDLEKVNVDLQSMFDDMQKYCVEIAPDSSAAAMLTPSVLRERCKEDAKEIVARQSSNSDRKVSHRNPGVMDLITDLTALMLQIKNLADNDHSAYELQVLEGTVEHIKQKLSPVNKQIFQAAVEVHMKQIENSLAINMDKLVIGPLGKV